MRNREEEEAINRVMKIHRFKEIYIKRIRRIKRWSIRVREEFYEVRVKIIIDEWRERVAVEILLINKMSSPRCSIQDIYEYYRQSDHTCLLLSTSVSDLSVNLPELRVAVYC